MARRLSLFCLALGLCLPASRVPAQERGQDVRVEAPDVDPPAHISLVDGAAVLERDGQTDPAPTNMPLLAGDRVRTDTGRVEILFADGSTLHLDVHTTVDFQSDELVRLLDGRIRLAIPGPNRRVGYRIDAPSASAEIIQPGEYRLAVLRGGADEFELAVLRGVADLVNENGRTTLRAGERAFARANTAPSNAYVFNSATWDAFDQWSEARRNQRLAVSTQYLPAEVRPYASSFDRYGDWRYEASYGYVWYPTVATSWRPYYYGRWATLRPYGWTWIGSDPWAWPTHHYGRWGFSAGLWFWIPGRTWGPAWVSWAYAPDYVSWCPLGWNNRPIFDIVGINIYRGYDPWRAWTVVPRGRFGPRFGDVRGVAVRFDSRTHPAFISRPTPPDSRDFAVPRSATPIRTAGAARPRSPVYTNISPSDSRGDGSRSRAMVGGVPSGAGSRSGGTPAPSPVPTDRTRAVPRSTPGEAAGTRSQPGPQITETPSEGRRAVPVDGRDDRVPRAMPRDERVYGSSGVSSSPYRGIEVDRRTPTAPPQVTTPYSRSRDTGSSESRGEPQRSGDGDRPGYGNPGVPRTMPREGPPPAPPTIERRGPAPERPSGPPPSAREGSPRDSGARDSGPRDSGPRDSGARSDGGRTRSGGQPAQGSAVPRRGGGR